MTILTSTILTSALCGCPVTMEKLILTEKFILNSEFRILLILELRMLLEM